MNSSLHRLIVSSVGACFCLTALVAAQAEDVEVFTGAFAPEDVGRPNILLVLDDSGSMGAEIVTQNDYDPAIVYDGGECNANPNLVYWSTSGSPPACNTANVFELAALACRRALDAFSALHGGSYRDYFAQFDAGDELRWERLSNLDRTRKTECEDDLPDPAIAWPGHGNGDNAARVYPRNGDSGELWTDEADSPNRVVWGAWPTDLRYTVFSGNYMNWYHGEASVTTRLELMKGIATNLINSMNGVNIGLMHFTESEGGEVIHAVSGIETSRDSIADAVDSLAAGGLTPLSETLYEAYLYMTGGPVDYGAGGVAAARRPDPNGHLYASPIENSCQKSHIVLLTDGEPTNDDGADDEIKGLVDFEGESFADLVGLSCDAEVYPPGFNPGGGDCLDELAEFMFKADLSPEEGRQFASTHTIGFLVDLPVLAETAARGGGEYRTATDTASLSTALTDIVTSILETQTAFTAPSVAINAFSQTRHANDIYMGLFQGSTSAHWPGNLKKFKLRAADATIVDANDRPVVDPDTGRFAPYVQDLWSETEDGANVFAGGAANQIPAARSVYTYLGDADLTAPSNRVNTLNLDDATLGTGDPDRPTAQQVVDFINGLDVADSDQDGNSAEPRRQMGDPLHSAPVVIVYGPGPADTLVFIGTNDGMLHAFNADDGSEAWSFLPPEFLGQQIDLLLDENSDIKRYGVDGSITVQTIGDNDGLIEPADGERVLLYFGMRRGGDAYYALDVTDPDSPEVLWHADSSDVAGLGQSWSSALPTRVDIQGAAQNQYKLALVVGGGYDPSQDAAETSTDGIGNSIYFLDALTGDLLWHATDDGGDQEFSSARWSMSYSIPGNIRAIDLDGDSFVDRLYAADMGGQVWRFDISNGSPASSLATGGVIAQLGAAGQANPSIEDTRRFYYAPDVALARGEGASFFHIGIGSGHRAHPNSIANHDEFYALRDYAAFTPMTQAQYDARVPIKPADLVDVTADAAANVPHGSPGWRLSLNDGGWRGEKVLAEARTFDDQIFVSTYRPGAANDGCAPTFGTTRQYIVSLFNAAPVTNLDGSFDELNLELTDRYREFEGPPPPETVFFFPTPEQDLDGDGLVDEQMSLACAADGDCLGEIVCIGLICTQDGGGPTYPVRTFWTQDGID